MKNKLIRKTLAIVLSAMIIFSALPISFGAFAETASSQRSFTDDFSNADFTSSNWEAAIPSAYNGTAFQTKNEASYITTEDERTVLRASDGASNTNNIGDLLTNMPKDRRVESVTATFKQPRDFANEDASSGIVAFHINSRNSLVLCVYPYVNSKNAEDPNNDYIYYSWCRYSYATADTKNAKNNCVEIYNDQVTNVKKWRYSTGLVGDITDWLTVTLTYDYSQIANNIITVSATLKDADGNEGTIPAFSAKFDDTVYDCTDADGNITESAAYLAYDENFRVGIAGSGVNYYCYYDSFSVQYGNSFSEIANEFRNEYSETLNISSINSNEQFEKVMEAHSALNALPANVKEQLSAEDSKLSGLLNSYKITCDDFENPNLFAGVWESIPYTGDIMTWNASSSSFITGTTTSGTPASVIADSQDSTNNVLAPEYRNISRKRKMLTLKEAYMRTDAQMKSFSTDVKCDLAVSWDASPGIYCYYKDVYNWIRIEFKVDGTICYFRVIEQAGTSAGENMVTVSRANNVKLSDTGTGVWYTFNTDYVYNDDSTEITLTVIEKSSGTVIATRNFTSEYIIGDDFRVGYGAVNLTTNPMCFDNFELGYYKTADEFRAEYAETLALTTATVTVGDTKAVLDAKEALDGLTNVVKAQLNKEVIHLTRLYNKILELKTLDTVYLSATGDDANDGTQNSPVATLDKAYQLVKDGGTISIIGTYTLASDFVWNNHGKTVTISGGTLNGAALSKGLILGEDVTFEDITLEFDEGDYMYANGHTVLIGENVTTSNAINLYGGGVKGSTVDGTDLTVLSGDYKLIFGGSNQGTVNGDTNLFLGGQLNANSVTALAHSTTVRIYGGGNNDTINGNTNVIFTGNAKTDYIFGGSRGANSVITGTANIDVSGSVRAFDVTGGSDSSGAVSNVNLKISGGEIIQGFGACQSATMTGNVNVELLGGKISRRFYGGCYNGSPTIDYTFGIIPSGCTWNTDYRVIGNITVTLSSQMQITYDAYDTVEGTSFEDTSFYAHSRNKNYSDEVSTLIFIDETAYNTYKNSLKAQDSSMKQIMSWSDVDTAADNIYYLSYTANGQVMTQKFNLINGVARSSNTATISVDHSVSTIYTGEAIEAAVIAYDLGWLGDKLQIVYANNVEVGTATASVTKGGATISVSYEITEDLTPAILGASISKSASQDIRFSCQFALTDKKVKEYGVIIAYYNRITNGDVALADMTVQTDNRYVTVGKVTLEMPVSMSGKMFYANIGQVPPTSYGYRYVARIFVKYEGDDTYYYSDGGNGSIESATGVENGYICRSVISIAKSILSWTYDNYEKMDDEYGVGEITEIISGKNDNGKYVWASGVTANNGEKVLAYLNENAEALSRAISAIKQ